MGICVIEMIGIVCLSIGWLVKTGRISGCSPGWPGIHYVNQTGMELAEIHVSLHSECRD